MHKSCDASWSGAGVLFALLATGCSSVPRSTTPVADAGSRQRGTAPGSGARSPSPASKVSIPKGYDLVKSGDQILYCRSEPITGTRFQTRVCLTETQYKSQQQAVQDAKEHLTLPHTGPCADKQCAGGG